MPCLTGGKDEDVTQLYAEGDKWRKRLRRGRFRTIGGRRKIRPEGMNRRFPRRLVRSAIAVALFSVTATTRVLANKESEALRARGSAEIYNLDRDQATATFREAIAADPQDAAAYRGLATSLWLSIT